MRNAVFKNLIEELEVSLGTYAEAEFMKESAEFKIDGILNTLFNKNLTKGQKSALEKLVEEVGYTYLHNL